MVPSQAMKSARSARNERIEKIVRGIGVRSRNENQGEVQVLVAGMESKRSPFLACLFAYAC